MDAFQIKLNTQTRGAAGSNAHAVSGVFSTESVVNQSHGLLLIRYFAAESYG